MMSKFLFKKNIDIYFGYFLLIFPEITKAPQPPFTEYYRPAQLAELPRSEFDPELFPHSAYVKFFVTFATKVPYLTFCDKM